MQTMDARKKSFFVATAMLGAGLRRTAHWLAWAADRAFDHIVFFAELVLMSIALFCYCLVMKKLPTQLQENELLAEYQEGVAHGRKDTLEKLTSLGHAFKQTPDGSVSIIPDTVELAKQTNQQLSS